MYFVKKVTHIRHAYYGAYGVPRQGQASIYLKTALSVQQLSQPKQVVPNKYIPLYQQHYKNRALVHATKARAGSGTALLFL